MYQAGAESDGDESGGGGCVPYIEDDLSCGFPGAEGIWDSWKGQAF